MTPHPAETPPVELHRITLDVYRNMGRLGSILLTDRVELLDGLLVKKMTKGPPGASRLDRQARQSWG